ncbi:TlpA disulfide reductase family protein [Mucilaginibacter psychrotolerans]|uniref:TlpA family protein disulfide reductase n=1 Tax=Mucilaginibacter psychrotolerans TaxID=1524096 RepID=A0A4Y8SFF8_9SPHI|nr:TlpA disulfide reductase family protein [Mucilaginibacter psychrotolerans]TFF37769.1 TlpA family protein disulfide reductase [Mucilaginibacter psychrotolerans]
MKNLKLIITFCLIVFSVVVKAQQGQIEYLDLGTKVTEYPKVEWLKGIPLTKFDKDKIYIIDLWATWCVPCIQAMPHLNALSQKFSNKNIVFIAQDVMEHDKAKVEKFIKGNVNMEYLNIGYSGPEGSDFDQKWVKPAGVSAIPQTFVIQNNIILWQTHPALLNESVIQLLLDGKFTIEAAKALSNGK